MAKSEFPESELVKNSFTIRSMDLPPSVKLTKRSLLRWFALAVGLISEKESRSTVLDVLDALFSLQLTKGISPYSNDIQSFFKKNNKKVSDKLLRYHLKRLVDLGLLQRKKLNYCFAYDPHQEKSDLGAGFKCNVSEPISRTLCEIESVLSDLQQSYRKK